MTIFPRKDEEMEDMEDSKSDLDFKPPTTTNSKKLSDWLVSATSGVLVLQIETNRQKYFQVTDTAGLPIECFRVGVKYL